MPTGIHHRPSIKERLFKKRRINIVTGCWEWQGAKEPRGYGFIWYEGKLQSVHRISAILFGVLTDLSKEAAHECDNSPCFNPGHLKQSTALQNMGDAVKRGRTACGEQHGNHKLSINDVHKIRELHGIATTKLAHQFSVCAPTIRAVLARRTWKKV